jgi:hypothetical protein
MKFHVGVRTIFVFSFSWMLPLLSAQPSRSLQQDRQGIAALHKLDVEMTVSGKADDLRKLWDKDAVRLLPNSPPEVGKTAIYATDKREEAAGSGRNVCYRPEVKDLEISGNWAFEWGYFSYHEAGMPKAIRGKVLRVIKRQPDGSWKFARVMALTDDKESAAPMANACR